MSHQGRCLILMIGCWLAVGGCRHLEPGDKSAVSPAPPGGRSAERSVMSGSTGDSSPSGRTVSGRGPVAGPSPLGRGSTSRAGVPSRQGNLATSGRAADSPAIRAINHVQEVGGQVQDAEPERPMRLPPPVDRPVPGDDEVPVPPSESGAEVIERPPGGSSDILRLEQVVESVQRAYPALQIAWQERQVADGKQLSARGAFDLQAKAFSIAGPLGYYQTYRNGLALTQPTYGGGYLYGGYKLGRGSFQPWFKERQTDDGGELAVGLGTPLLKNRDIDERRAELFDAQLARRAVEPAAQSQLLDLVRQATQVYWIWVASGLSFDAHEELLRLAQLRVGQIEERVRAGDLPEIARINNDQLIASRETKVIEARRKLQMSAIKLSLFWRSPTAEPIVPEPGLLPAGFPDSSPPDADQLDRDVATAVARRPEIVELNLATERVRVQLSKARNDLLPKLDLMLQASKDVGARATKKGDKTPFELEAGLYGEVPLQRREAQGKIESARGKLAQLQSKRQFAVDKITAQVRDAVSALTAAHGAIQQAARTVELAERTLELGRAQFDAGDIDLVELNIYEQSVMDARLRLIGSQADYFIALADYRAALAGGEVGFVVD